MHRRLLFDGFASYCLFVLNALQTLNMLASDNLWSDPDDRKTRRSKAGGGGGGGGGLQDDQQQAEQGEEGGDGRARSVMIFVSKCRK